MPNPRSTRKRARRLAGLAPHWRGLLTGEPQPSMNAFAWSVLHRKAATDAELAERIATVERHAELIPGERRPVIERYLAAWRGELSPGEIGDRSRWWMT